MTAAEAAAGMTTTAIVKSHSRRHSHQHQHHHHHHNHNRHHDENSYSSLNSYQPSLNKSEESTNNNNSPKSSSIHLTAAQSTTSPNTGPHVNTKLSANCKTVDSSHVANLDGVALNDKIPLNNSHSATNHHLDNTLDNKHTTYKLRKEQEDFNNRLIEFHRHKAVNTPIISWPTFNGKYVDLSKLYTKVVDIGGWERVCEKEKWTFICSYLDKSVLHSCTNSSHALKLIYLRYLSVYEKVHMSPASTALGQVNILPVGFVIDNYLKTTSAISLLPANNNSASSLGFLTNTNNAFNGASIASTTASNYRNASTNLGREVLDDRDDDMLGNMTKKRFNYLFESVPMNYNYSQHANPVNNNTNVNNNSNFAVSLNSVTSSIAAISQSSQPHDFTSNLNNNTSSLTSGGLLQSGVSNNSSLPTSSSLVLPSSLFNSNPYEKLEVSLNSGLPNEIDFVFNTIVLLSSDESHAFRVYSSPRLISLMLAHIGFFGTDDKYNYRYLYDNVWNSYLNDDLMQTDNTNLDNLNNRMENKLKCKPRRNFVKFWHNAIKFPEDSLNSKLYDIAQFIDLLPKLYNDCK